MQTSNIDREWDVIIVGGGVVGCAVMRKFTLLGARVLLLERGGDILSGASKANSAILHTGFDAPPASVELDCMKRGYEEFLSIHRHFNLPVLKTGAFVVAWDEAQLKALPGIVEKAHQNGIMNVREISVDALYQQEPNLGKGALGAVSVPDECVIDPWSTPLAYMTQAVEHGAKYEFHCEVTHGEFNDDRWTLTTSKGDFRTKIVINCAGINGDIVENICRPSPFTIHPRKGQFLVFDKSAAQSIDAIILPVPTAVTKGVLISKTIFGNLLVGPTAEEQEDRWHAAVSKPMLEDLKQQGTALLPSLINHAVTATYAGLRPATEYKDYQLSCVREKNWLCAGGIRSTGLTSALGIAQVLAELFEMHLNDKIQCSPVQDIHWPKMPNLAQHLTRAYEQPDNGGVVCHCELVTQSEIEAVFASSVPPECIGGLRRRTRVMMGRCNGFYCSSHVNKLIDQNIEQNLSVGDIL
ncbi:NAD(P)/FAD-dependent oxidoreductase [Photobacterium sp. GJ3]|uniref:NAD(P)/FAD-dependent oxidoreductase n=1 Tax=Photobacterium sp. GJ3 TaxID=2829502 RepID=UPI001B8C74C8|nr:NAD(P)/FAD-dependent oxidoreductase [Photobacterium sp. GJ3]QUJ66622.1 NAD(P)/FAD-dependent oxidoreductase [Photobacterium sp. GJ3]